MHVRGSGGNIFTWDDYLYENGQDNTGNVWSEVCVCDEFVKIRAGKRGMREGWVSSWQRKNNI